MVCLAEIGKLSLDARLKSSLSEETGEGNIPILKRLHWNCCYFWDQLMFVNLFFSPLRNAWNLRFSFKRPQQKTNQSSRIVENKECRQSHGFKRSLRYETILALSVWLMDHSCIRGYWLVSNRFVLHRSKVSTSYVRLPMPVLHTRRLL